MRIFCMVHLLTFPALLLAQENVTRIWEPSVTYTYTTNDYWRVTYQLSAFQSSNRLERIEISVMPLRRLSPRSTAGFGYLNRLGTPFEPASAIENRIVLQYGYQHPWRIHQASHRFRLEERIRDGSFTHRFRYRLSLRSPLQGDRLDAGEYYLLTQNEGLASISEYSFNGENRISMHVGYLLQNRQRIEIGFQHRAGNLFTRHEIGHVALLSTVWHFTN